MAYVKILKQGQDIAAVRLSDFEWSLINYVDYIEVDSQWNVPNEWVRAHGFSAAHRMELLAVGTTENVNATR